jgi:multiple sugar transport system permease protein
MTIGWREVRLKSQNSLTAIAFHLPAWITLLLIIVVPLIVAAYFSFSDMNLARAGLNFRFTGLENYRSILVDRRFWFSFRITVIFIFWVVGIELIAGTIIAVLLNTIMFGRRLFMSLIMVPMMLAPLVVGLTWTFLLNPQFGAGTWLIQELNIPLPRAILSDLRFALPAVIFADVWEWTPFMVLVVLSGLQTVPVTLLDAARVDGASYWQQVWHVMLPIIRPILIIGAFLRSVDAFRIFDIPYILTGGGPGSATEIIDLFTYRLAFKSWDMGKGMTVGIILFILNVLLSLILYRWMPQAENVK